MSAVSPPRYSDSDDGGMTPVLNASTATARPSASDHHDAPVAPPVAVSAAVAVVSPPSTLPKRAVIVVASLSILLVLLLPSIGGPSSNNSGGSTRSPTPLDEEATGAEGSVVIGGNRDEGQRATSRPPAQGNDQKKVASLPAPTTSKSTFEDPRLKQTAAANQHLALTSGWNPSDCPNGQPNRTDIEPYKGCPLPGLNNLLYTQHNRWYCVYRDNERMMVLRDRTCNKGSGEKYRYSTMLQVRYDRLLRFNEWKTARKAAGINEPITSLFGNSRHRGGHPGLMLSQASSPSDPPAVRKAFEAFQAQMHDETPLDPTSQQLQRLPAALPKICWADIREKVLPKKCTWSDIPSFYGKSDWWEARQFIDFHSEYYVAARRILAAALLPPPASNDADGLQRRAPLPPFISLHLRRGDYLHHCKVIRSKRIPPMAAFWSAPSMLSADGSAFESCYPTVEQVEEVISRVTAETGINLVFIATNVPDEFANLTTPIDKLLVAEADSTAGAKKRRRPWKAFVLPKLTQLKPPPLTNMRHLDTLVLDMVVLSLGSYFVLNRYSSFSGTVYEMAAIHGRANGTNVRCW